MAQADFFRLEEGEQCVQRDPLVGFNVGDRVCIAGTVLIRLTEDITHDYVRSLLPAGFSIDTWSENGMNFPGYIHVNGVGVGLIHSEISPNRIYTVNLESTRAFSGQVRREHISEIRIPVAKSMVLAQVAREKGPLNVFGTIGSFLGVTRNALNAATAKHGSSVAPGGSATVAGGSTASVGGRRIRKTSRKNRTRKTNRNRK